MINQALIVVSWFLIGLPLPYFIEFGLVLAGFLCLLRYRYRHISFPLIGLMGLMFIQYELLVLIFHFYTSHADFALPNARLFQILFGMDLRLAELGAIVAICLAIYIHFGQSRLSLSQAFPSLHFLEPTDSLANTVRTLSKSAGIECPEIRLLDSGEVSALTVKSRGRYYIAVSVGLIESFDSTEVEACIAHEIAHIKNRDFVLRLVVTLVRVAMFTRVLGILVENAFYRSRELLADRTAAILTGGPGPLISALTKLQETYYLNDAVSESGICSFNGRKKHFEVLSKHPNLDTRIGLLKEMALRPPLW